MIFFKQRKPMRSGGKRPVPGREQAGLKTYEERMDEITQWNIEHTDIEESSKDPVIQRGERNMSP
jgi:hypothetical protein